MVYIYSNGQYYNYEDTSPPNTLDTLARRFGNDLTHLIISGVCLGILFVCLICLCWKTCDSDDEDRPQPSGKMVIAREIRPGMMVIQGHMVQPVCENKYICCCYQGTNEETLRIIEEYEAARHGYKSGTPVQTFQYATTMPHDYMTCPVPRDTTHHVSHSYGATSQYPHTNNYRTNSYEAATQYPGPVASTSHMSQLTDLDFGSRPPPYAPGSHH